MFIPDWFKGEPCPIEWYPPATPEHQKNLGAFFGKNPPAGVADKLPEVVKALSAKHPSIKSWGLLGVSCPAIRLRPVLQNPHIFADRVNL